MIELFSVAASRLVEWIGTDPRLARPRLGLSSIAASQLVEWV